MRLAGRRDSEDRTGRSTVLRAAGWVMPLLIVGSLGCAMATSYGVKPKRDVLEPDLYAFTIYFNAFAMAYDIEQKAKRQISDFMRQEGYQSFTIENRDCSGAGGKCIYEVRFSRSGIPTGE